MAKKKSYDYFGKMAEIAEKSHQAAQYLKEVLESYNYEELIHSAEKIHHLEREADEIEREIYKELAVSFITPIDREDIVLATTALDDVIDDINSITYLFENLVVKELRPRTLEMVEFIVEVTKGVHETALEFPKFKNSKILKNWCEKVNSIEGEADQVYSSLVKDLFTHEKDSVEIIRWHQIYRRMEKTIDDSEKVVDIIEGLVIKNL